MFLAFVEQLKSELSKDLPGSTAQQLMAPAHRLSSEHYQSTIKSFRPGSVMILLYEKDEQAHFVLTLRQSYQGIHSAQVSFPGGKIEEQDQSPTHAALRETEEEIGVKGHELEVIGSLTQLYIPPSNFMIYPSVSFAPGRLEFRKDEKEVAQIIEVAVKDLLNEDLVEYKAMDLSRGTAIPGLNAVRVPYFNFYGHQVWGATAMVLSEFKQLLRSMDSQNYF